MTDSIDIVKDGSFALTLAEIERLAIKRALEITKNRSEAATVLGIGRTTLFRKIAEYDLCEERKRRKKRQALLAKIEQERIAHESAGTLKISIPA